MDVEEVVLVILKILLVSMRWVIITCQFGNHETEICCEKVKASYLMSASLVKNPCTRKVTIYIAIIDAFLNTQYSHIRLVQHSLSI